MQKEEANKNFADFIKSNYADWLQGSDDGPMLSHQLMERNVFPLIGEDPVFLIVIDNLRLDQWKVLESEIAPYFNIESQECYYSILPTTTGYARNAIFSGMLPAEMEKHYPDFWVGEETDEGKKQF